MTDEINPMWKQGTRYIRKIKIKANYIYVRENEGTLVNGQFRDNKNKNPK